MLGSSAQRLVQEPGQRSESAERRAGRSVQVWWARRDSNPGPPACEASSRPLLFPRFLSCPYYFQQSGESALRSISNSSRCWRWGFDTVLIRCIRLAINVQWRKGAERSKSTLSSRCVRLQYSWAIWIRSYPEAHGMDIVQSNAYDAKMASAWSAAVEGMPPAGLGDSRRTSCTPSTGLAYTQSAGSTPPLSQTGEGFNVHRPTAPSLSNSTSTILPSVDAMSSARKNADASSRDPPMASQFSDQRA